MFAVSITFNSSNTSNRRQKNQVNYLYVDSILTLTVRILNKIKTYEYIWWCCLHFSSLTKNSYARLSVVRNGILFIHLIVSCWVVVQCCDIVNTITYIRNKTEGGWIIVGVCVECVEMVSAYSFVSISWWIDGNTYAGVCGYLSDGSYGVRERSCNKYGLLWMGRRLSHMKSHSNNSLFEELDTLKIYIWRSKYKRITCSTTILA